ncbi:MAG: PIG-L family deacetylase [Actinomycetota bacterium]|nr:PIG-L family deacetylase [Actinomycetota bacterium]
MISLGLHGGGDAFRRLLLIGAHADDIEIGCGGTLLRLIQECPRLEVCWVVLSGGDERASEAEVSAQAFLHDVEQREIVLRRFRDGFFPYCGGEIKDFFEELKTGFAPDIVFTHRREDLHQDHRTVAELTWNTFRSHLILEYEIPKYEGDLGAPNVFVELSEEICQRKVAGLLDGFPSQRGKRWFTEDLFLSLLRLRGMESGSAGRFAEAFHCRKILL